MERLIPESLFKISKPLATWIVEAQPQYEKRKDVEEIISGL
jgi:hypothetical protein